MQFVYFPIGGRGELIRLIAAVGGVTDFNESTEMPEGVTKADCGSTGSVPLLIDGELKMNESTAMEFYVASVAPKFADLTPQQRGKDAQFCSLKETCLGGIAKGLFGKDNEAIVATAEKFFPIIEGILPDEGFVNGLDFPTVADLAVLNIVAVYMPFGAAYKAAGVDVEAKFPKLMAHANKVKEVDAVAKYLEGSVSVGAAMGGF